MFFTNLIYFFTNQFIFYQRFKKNVSTKSSLVSDYILLSHRASHHRSRSINHAFHEEVLEFLVF